MAMDNLSYDDFYAAYEQAQTDYNCQHMPWCMEGEVSSFEYECRAVEDCAPGQAPTMVVPCI